MRLINWLICKISGHDFHVHIIYYESTKFVNLYKCKRCSYLWWMKGEHGRFKGVRIAKGPGTWEYEEREGEI